MGVPQKGTVSSNLILSATLYKTRGHVGKVTRGHGEIPKYEMRTRSVSPPGRTDNAQHWGGALKRSAINLILSATLYKTRGQVGTVTWGQGGDERLDIKTHNI